MQNQNSEENKVLFNLVNINKDACNFYAQALVQAENKTIRDNFKSLEDLHQSVANDILNCIRANGGDMTEENGTFVGKTTQFFGTLAAKLSHNVDETLVSFLEEAEDRCLHSVQDAINQDDVRPQTRAILREELSTLQKTHDYMKTLKDALHAD